MSTQELDNDFYDRLDVPVNSSKFILSSVRWNEQIDVQKSKTLQSFPGFFTILIQVINFIYFKIRKFIFVIFFSVKQETNGMLKINNT